MKKLLYAATFFILGVHYHHAWGTAPLSEERKEKIKYLPISPTMSEGDIAFYGSFNLHPDYKRAYSWAAEQATTIASIWLLRQELTHTQQAMRKCIMHKELLKKIPLQH